MLSPEIVLAMSLKVRDAAGHHPIRPIARDGAIAIAEECSRASISGPIVMADATETEVFCTSLYLAQGFRESGLQLRARGDCLDHLWDSGTEEYKKTHPRYYEPDKDGKCRPGDGEPTSFGPFQERTQPKTWAEAVATFSRTLKRAEEVCAHDEQDPTCTPIEVVATGRTRTKIGKQIAKIRYAEAERITLEMLFADDPRVELGQ